MVNKATGNSRSGIPGNRRPQNRRPQNSKMSEWTIKIEKRQNSYKFPAISARISEIPGNFWNSGGNCGEFIGVLSFFPIFIVHSDILLFNLPHCIMCTTHDKPRLTAFWAKPGMTSLTQLIVFIVKGVERHNNPFQNFRCVIPPNSNKNKIHTHTLYLSTDFIFIHFIFITLLL